MFLSFAQNAEDVRLNRCFCDQPSGFFIDVGASEPTRHSVTYALYLQGWRGISIEPLPDRFNELMQLRPEDINLNFALGHEPGRATLYRSLGRGGTSTIIQQAGEELQSTSQNILTSQTQVETLANVCRKFASHLHEYELLKIDVEGAEELVFQGADLLECRPLIIVFEGQYQNNKLHKFFTRNRYRFVTHDGLNFWYCCETRQDYAELLSHPVSVKDKYKRLDHLGSPLTNESHPEHRWAVSFAQVMIGASNTINSDMIISAYLDRLADHLAAKEVDWETYKSAVRSVLGRQPSLEEWNRVETHIPPLSTKEIYKILILSDEFLMKRGKSIASM